ncbi:hypothetical protein NQ314_009044 [Rhamnusium bicolor]|uniref:Uncharacterized protein n=1 Tax=Rhamnusium bicolor TaxID=1586634 RepID=A0AAV8Y2X5_9CUCU|nr:hypothetical protein NQ314_009044 [Rhamnusium bicolor]
MFAVTETREDIPLNKGKKSESWYSCNEDCLNGSKFVNVAFGTLTFVITVALLVQIYYGDYQVVPHGSVATDSLECSKIGTSILKKGGNAIDAAIASAFCLAVAAPHVTGLDAESQLLIYNHRTRLLPNIIDFSGPTAVSKNLPHLVLSLAYTHQQYGSLAWKDLVQPAAELAEQGYLISKILVEAVSKAKAEDLYGRLEPGQILKHENLSRTLKKIASMPNDELYGYIKTMNQPIISQAIKSTFNSYDIYVPNTPSIGQLVIANLQKVEEFNFTKEDTNKPEYIYRLAETTQTIYGEQNISAKYHEGTSSNIAVIDLYDNYVSLVTGMYDLFGSGEMTTHGYILDVKNKEKPCSRVPFVITDGNLICGRRMVFGANDLSVATQLVTSLLIANENATESIESPRFHVFRNGTIGIEGSHLPAFNEDIVNYLQTLTPNLALISEPYSSSNIVEKVKDDLSSHSDSRGGGIASRF